MSLSSRRRPSPFVPSTRRVPAPSAALLALALLAAPVVSQWQPQPAFATPREAAVGLVVGGQILALSGLPVVNGENAPVQVLSAGAWVEATPLEDPLVHQAAGVDALGRVIVFGGVPALGDNQEKTVQYDLVEGQSGGVAQRSATAPDDLVAWAVDDQQRLYSIGGTPLGFGVASGHVERYDATTDTWTVLAALPTPVADAAAVWDGAGGVLVLGGRTSDGVPSTNVARFDVATGTWSDDALPDLPVALTGLRAVRGADGRLYALGGHDGTATQATVWVLDPSGSAFYAGPPMTAPRRHFGAVLGPDDHVWVLGGAADGGGTASVESLYTPACPVLVAAPQDTTLWAGQAVQLSAAVFGGLPMGYGWSRDGVPLVDGPAPSGAVVSGASTANLLVTGATPAESGLYVLSASNGCGSLDTPAATLVVVHGPVADEESWTLQTLHPAGALVSTAYGVDADGVAGSSSYSHPTYGQLEHPTLWSLPGLVPHDVTPAGSVGGAIAASVDGVHAGWYWWPYNTPQGTAYHKHASVWTGTGGAQVDVQPSGWEYGALSDTDGSHHVGTLTWNDSSTTSDAGYWPSTQKYAVILTPPEAWGSSASCMDGDRQFGNVNLGFGVVHAAMWSGTAASFVDINPPGSSWSYVTAAGDGQQVGRATFGGEHHAVLWSGGPDGVVDLHPPGASSSEARAAHGGLQLGSAVFTGGTAFGLWSGTADSFTPIDVGLPPGFTSGVPRDLLVSQDGTLLVVGSGYNAALGRTEALLWTSRVKTLVGAPVTLSGQVGGSQELSIDVGAAHAGRPYMVLGSLSGTAPGLQVKPTVHLPLNPDVWLEFTASTPNTPILNPSFGFLDRDGRALLHFNVPSGLVVPGTFTFHHAALVGASPAGIALSTNAEALVLEP